MSITLVDMPKLKPKLLNFALIEHQPVVDSSFDASCQSQMLLHSFQLMRLTCRQDVQIFV